MHDRQTTLPLALSAFAALAFTTTACIEDEAVKTCIVAGVEHAVGDTFPSADGCNTCSCGQGGEVSCTLMGCVETCTYDGVVHQAGATFPSTDGCNTCTCGDGGQVSCTEIACPPTTCAYNGVTHQVGDTFPAGDGCNDCSCGSDGQVLCTARPCASGCTYEGQSYAVGDEFPAGDGCNTCECQADTSVTCTRIGCADTCTYDRRTWAVGDTFPAVDGCNTCTCMAGGQVGCTEIACQTCDAQTDWWRQYYGHSSEECAAVTFGCLEGVQRFENDCGCGCEQPAACAREIDCFYPECDASIVAVNCPYSTIDSSRDCSAELACPPNDGQCSYPGQDLGCGICYRPADGTCLSDAECTTGTLCEPLRCACEPTSVCLPGCTAATDCGEGRVCGDGGRCVATACAGAADCPPNFRCDSGGCLRKQCTASDSCDGACVLGQCYSEPGTCTFPVP